MLWLFFVVAAYFLFAIVSLADKYLLTQARLKPAIMVFYVGVLGMVAFLAVPFVGFSLPDARGMILSMGAGIAFSYSLFLFFRALRIHEASRIVPAIGAFIPLFTLLLVAFLPYEKESLSPGQLVSFVLLIAGTVLIAREEGKPMHMASMKDAVASSLVFSAAFVLAKEAYLEQSFWPAFLLMRLGGLLVSVWLFGASKGVRDEVFGKGEMGSGVSFREMPRISAIFLLSQGAGALGEVLRNIAVFWVPLGMLPFIHALSGAEYVFLLFFAVLLSWKFPSFLKERISRSVLFHKAVAIACIGAGLILLSLQ